jgi:dihydropteroate synthase
MGILNVTPDSFSDGGAFMDPGRAVERIRAMEAEGADIVDIGGESTRPGSGPTSPEEQWRRIGPVFERAARESLSCYLSVDTGSTEVASRALECGASIINDIRCLRDPGLAETAAATGAGLILMHMQGTPETMQEDPHYDDLLSEVRTYIARGISRAVEQGVAEEQIVVDPGIGFGKTIRHNLDLISGLKALEPMGRPVLLGASRKGFIGKILDLPVTERVEGSLAVHVAAVLAGAHIVRVHDVAATVRAVRMADALLTRATEETP